MTIRLQTRCSAWQGYRERSCLWNVIGLTCGTDPPRYCSIANTSPLLRIGPQRGLRRFECVDKDDRGSAGWREARFDPEDRRVALLTRLMGEIRSGARITPSTEAIRSDVSDVAGVYTSRELLRRTEDRRDRLLVVLEVSQVLLACPSSAQRLGTPGRC